jgi:hypothetical protein
MFFRTQPDVLQALEAFGESKASLEAWEHMGPIDGTILVRYPNELNASHWVSSIVPKWFSPAHGWLFWVSQTGVFPSLELTHIYYTLRASHGNREDIRTSPGHEFLGYETADLRSFLFLAISFGWDAHLVTFGGPGRAFFSHDGWFRLSIDLHLLPALLEDLNAVGAEYA